MKSATNNDVAIQVQQLRKEFLLPHQRKTSLKQVFVSLGSKNYKTRQHVLKGIDFEVYRGEFFGIVGRNGSGKSTLLKILAGVYRPSGGSIAIHGELTPFIELGVGFNPELSGRDNVYLNGALLGFSRSDMHAMYDEIVAFSELEDFMDQKLKNYSSGMQVRLAFSIAIKAHNDILIFDEVLAVGDEAFQRKCLDVFEEYKANKQTVILVTHDMETVRRFCTRAMLVHDGEIAEIGDPRKVASKYSQLNQESINKALAVQNNLAGNSAFPRHLKVAMLSAAATPKVQFETGETMRLAISWDGLEDIDGLGVHIFKASGEHMTGVNPRNDKVQGWKKKQSITLDIDLNLTTGMYYLMIEAFRREGEVIDVIAEGPRFAITNDGPLPYSGMTNLKHTWQLPR